MPNRRTRTFTRREFVSGMAALGGASALAGVTGRGPRWRAANVVLRVELPSDRGRAGRLWIVDDAGKMLGGPWRVLGKADGMTATKHKNATRNRLLPFGDTPTGNFKVVGGFKVGDGTPYSARSYGIHGALRLDPIAGDAKIAKDVGGRIGLLIHGGDLGAGNRLRPTNGCLRLSNADMKAMLDELFLVAVIAGNIVGACTVSNVAVQVTDPSAAADEGYDEGDPPPTDAAPRLP